MINHLAIAEQVIAHSGAQDAGACEASYRGAVLREGTRAGSCPHSAYPELVEGLSFSSGGARGLKNQDSASTSSAWTDFGEGRAVFEGGDCAVIQTFTISHIARGGTGARRSIACGEAALVSRRSSMRNSCDDVNGLRPALLLRVSASPREYPMESPLG